MSKKKVELNKGDLSTTTLGKVNSKKRKPFLLIFLIILFTSVVYFFPQIETLINKYTNPEVIVEEKPDIILDEDVVIEEEQETIEKYDYKKDLTINSDLFSLTNIVYEKNVLKFNLKGNKNVDLENYNYFLEAYSENKTLLTRIMLVKEKINLTFEKEYIYELEIEKIAYFQLRNISQDEYPLVALEQDVNGLGELICENKLETLKYTFRDLQLLIVEKQVMLTEENIVNYELLVGSENGVSNTINEERTIFKSLINLNIYNGNDPFYFKKDTHVSIVKFELETNGFSCR